MWFPTNDEVKNFMEKIKEVYEEKEKDDLSDDVVRMCDLLSLLLDRCMESPNPLPENVKQHFRDIYRSLKLHMEFHGFGRDAAADILNLRKVGEYLELGADDAPEIECAIDPGSKLLEIFSIMALHNDGLNLGSEEHAEGVWQMATDLLRYLNKPLEGRERLRNRFRPKVLTKVSRRDEKEKKKKWSVGSSVAVSHFLRPLYLYNRIRHFKPSLKRAVILNEPLETAETNAEWQSEAFGGEGYERSKRPCQTCYSKFGNLQCFQNGESDQREFSSAQCAEYCPINQLLPLDQEVAPEDEITQELDTVLGQFRQRCWFLYENFGNIAQICQEALNFEDMRDLREAYEERVRDSVLIFGISPELNGSLRPT